MVTEGNNSMVPCVNKYELINRILWWVTETIGGYKKLRRELYLLIFRANCLTLCHQGKWPLNIVFENCFIVIYRVCACGVSAVHYCKRTRRSNNNRIVLNTDDVVAISVQILNIVSSTIRLRDYSMRFNVFRFGGRWGI